MLGSLIASLEQSETATALIATLGVDGLAQRVEQAAAAATMESADYLSMTVLSFMETASDEHFVQLVGIMNQAEDPGLAAIRAILMKALPEARAR
ncbi:hypothetical protein C5748_19625 [Phyllobacterium phragmitis]|uniref:Uncharacterized protein n=1 Tax=Phyllobacterium phragmitis TaxID=2670329 RepID=A0A2S9IMV5_9HYPH|nr:hypothetical protein [Phyllobacterium phragmitis]PRD41864.1 hypothetical protein C5748_19625 [Phyllobacterium phragmitis]